MPDIFDEVEEDLRAERARSFGRRFGGLAAAGVLLVLVGTGAYVWWGQQQAAVAQRVAERFIAAAKQADKAARPLGGLDQAQATQAAATFTDIAANGPSGYKVLARLRLAALQWQLGQQTQAVASWQSVATDAAAPQLLRDFATVTSAQYQVDTANPTLLKQSVETLTAPTNPWRPMADQVIALIDVRQGRTREAAQRLRSLTTDVSAPEGVRQMAADLLTSLPKDAEKPPAAASPAHPPASPAAAPVKPASHG